VHFQSDVLSRVREVVDRSKQHCFELYSAINEVIKACKTDSEGKVVSGILDYSHLLNCKNPTYRLLFCIGKHTVYRMSSATEEEKDEWIKSLQ